MTIRLACRERVSSSTPAKSSWWTLTNGNFITDGQRFTISDNQAIPATRTFEFDDGSGPPVGGGLVPVNFNVGMTRDQIVAAIVNAINSQTQFRPDGSPVWAVAAQALPTADANFNNRISLINATVASEAADGISIQGSRGVAAGSIRIPIEEVSRNSDFALNQQITIPGLISSMTTSFQTVATFEFGGEGTRGNFLGSNFADFGILQTSGVFTNLNHDMLPPAGKFAVPFLASDTASEVAQRMVDAIDGTFSGGTILTATSNGPVVTLGGNARFINVDDPPLTLAGAAPGGNITGMTFVGSTLYAVSDEGGLYRIFNFTSPGGAFGDYIETGTDLLGINFQGLTAGPRNLEGGAYAQTLFGIEGDGTVHAFDLQGNLLPIFVNGATSIETGIFNANGLTFSEFEENPWHIVNLRRDEDPGHGVNRLFDLSREPEKINPEVLEGNSSFYFGRRVTQATDDRTGFQPGPEVSTDDRSLPNANYDFPGGVHGVLESNLFSLEGYAAEDLPVLYFNYYLVTEASNNQPMRDSFRVYIADSSGQWELLASNVEDPNVFTGEPLYDIGQNGAPDSWRQARVDLGAYAGSDNLRLRFDFTTAGTMSFGDPNRTGDELRTIAGVELRDGQTFRIDGQTFEIDLGPTFVAAEGKDIADGETLTVHGVTFEFDKDGVVNVPGATRIAIDDAQSAQSVAEALDLAMRVTDYTFTADLTAEDNDVIARAIDSGLHSGANIFQASGNIGDNPAFTFSPGFDVDMVRVDMNQGDKMDVTITLPPTSSFDAHLRVFDSGGVELATTTASTLTFTAPLPGDYYVGISGDPNSGYDPLTTGFGAVGSTGDYNVQIVTNDFAGVLPRLHDNRLQLDGASQVAQSIGAASSIDGADGVRLGNTAVVLHADMTAEEVASLDPSLRDLNGQARYVPVVAALADVFAGGQEFVIKNYKDLVNIIGHNLGDPGPFGGATFLPLDFEGALNDTRCQGAGTNDFACGTDNNDFEGIYLDDFIIGFAEHGEFATASTPVDAFTPNPDLRDDQILVGEYDLEIRRAEDYGILTSIGTIYYETVDTNYRQEQSIQLLAPSADDVIDGQSFSISDGVATVRFEFEDLNINDGVSPGAIPILFDPTRFEFPGVGPDPSSLLAQRIRDAINSPQVQAILDVTAGLADGSISGSTTNRVNLYGNAIVTSGVAVDVAGDLLTERNDTNLLANRPSVAPGQSAVITASGNIGDNPALLGNNAALDVDLMALALTGGSTLRIDIDADELGSTVDTIVRVFDVGGTQIAVSDDFPAPGEPFTLDSYLEITVPATGTYYIGVSSFANFNYNIFNQASGSVGGSTGAYEMTVEIEATGIEFVQFDGLGDLNRERVQGQVVIENSTITRAQGFGVVLDSGDREPGTGEPNPGSVRNLRELNTNRLTPGAVVQNNIITFNALGGIEVSGQTNGPGDPLAPVPFARIVNNTLVGTGGTLETRFTGGNDVGVAVGQNASPTLLNNIVANFTTGVTVDATSQSTVLGGMLYQGNGVNAPSGVGSFPIALGVNDPLFQDLETENFYPAALSRAIDSSINALEDRLSLVSVKNPLGIAPSPILAPELDAIGQLRADDPDVEPPAGFGSNVFVDRGAVDRADFVGPTAILTDPRDNDADGLDIDPTVTVVERSSANLFGFSIQLVDGLEPTDPQNGVGVNDATVTEDQVLVLQDDRILEEGLDYRFRYDALNNIIRLTPLSGIWENNHVYTIVLANSDRFVIDASVGGGVVDGDAFTLTDLLGNSAGFEFDSGYGITVTETLSLQIPQEGGGLGGMTDRETIVVSNGTDSATLEFDNNGSVAGGSIPVVFTPTSTDDQIAAALVAALNTADIGLSPRALANGKVHMGTTAGYVVDVSGAPSITRSGFEDGGVQDGDLLIVDDETRVITYEFDNDGVTATGNTRFAFTNSETFEDLGQAIAARLAADVNQLTPEYLGDGFIQVGGEKFIQIDASQSSLTLAGVPGVTPAFGLQIPSVAGDPAGVDDGDTFVVGDGIGLPVTFEFDSDNSVVPGNTRIAFTASSTLDQLADAIAAAISSVNIGLNPTNEGHGCIDLGGNNTLHFFNPGTSSLTQLGQPGVPGNIAIPFVPFETFTDEDLAEAVRDAINASDLEGVTATVRGGKIILEGVQGVVGIDDSFVSGIRDLADNPLKANQANGETTFTVVLGSGLDFGDAPESYGTLSPGGPSHAVDNEFHLGSDVDVEVDGRFSDDALGDDESGRADEDGVTFDSWVGGYETTIDIVVAGVTGSRPGFVSAWVDFDGSGSFDSNEQIITDAAVINGLNVFTVAVPPSVVTGETFARFRLSSETGLGTGGAASNGEVEDYRIDITVSHWRNPVNNLDVEPDGALTPFDVLRVVSLLQREGLPVFLPKDPPYIGGSVFSPPPYVDPNGDGRVDLRDALLVVNALYDQANGEFDGDGEGEGEFVSFVDAAEGQVAGVLADDQAEGEGGFTALALASNWRDFDLGEGEASISADLGTRANLEASNGRRVREFRFRLPNAAEAIAGATVVNLRGEMDDQLLDSLLPQGSDAEAHDDFFAEF